MGAAPVLKGKFDVPDVRGFVPRRLKPWIFIFFVIIFQLSGGVYLAATTQMTGSTSLMQEDIMMAGYASLIGLSLNFTVMFRLKFRYSLRTSLKTCCFALIVCNLICLYTTNLFVLVGASLVAGWFRMWATFACNSTIQLWITPNRDMAVWLSYIMLLVDGVIQFTGILYNDIAFWANWEYMHWLMIGLLAVVFILTSIFIRHWRSMPKLPLYGIDWLGMLLWGVFFLCVTFVCIYGDHYDWLDSDYICIAVWGGTASLAINIWRMGFLRHPYLSPMTITNHRVVKVILLYLAAYLFLAPEHTLEHVLTGEILGYDSLHQASLNWFVWAGVISGCGFTYIVFARMRWTYKTMTFIGFFMISVYLCGLYFIVDHNIAKEVLAFPLFCRGAATVILSITFLTSLLQAGLPFPLYGQCISVNGYLSAVVGGTLGSAVVGEIFQHTMAKNFMLLSSSLTASSRESVHLGFGELAEMVQRQALAVSIKEVYGWLLLLSLIALAAIAVTTSGMMRPAAIHPKWSTIRKGIKSSLRIYKKLPLPWGSH